MAIVDLPYSISNATQSAPAQLNDNFTAISAQVNGGLDGDNLSGALTCATLTAADNIITPVVDTAGAVFVIKLPSNDGSNKFEIKDYQGHVMFRVISSGTVEIPA